MDWDRETGGRNRLPDRRSPVITSYSIHYTKLYEVNPDKFPDVGINVDAGKKWTNFMISDDTQQFVITSYSIHYTKLYDGKMKN